MLLIPVLTSGQLTTGVVEGTVHRARGEPAKYVALTIVSGKGFRIAIQTDSDGRFTFSAPYGRYTVSSSSPPADATAVPVTVEPLRTAFLDLSVDISGRLHRSKDEADLRERSTSTLTTWLGSAAARTWPLGFSLQSIVAGREPTSIAVPTDFTGLTDNRLALISQRALSWTNTQFKLQGLDGTDSYQPGRPNIVPDVQSLAQIVVRTGEGLLASNSYGSEVGAFLAIPEAAWHGSIATFGTGSGLSSNNVPEMIGLVKQPERFNWFTRDRIELGGPVTRWADLFGSWAGQWASQTIGIAQPGQDQESRLLIGHFRADFRAGSHDRIDAQYSGSRLRLSNWGSTAGIESLTSRRMSPEFDLPNGFSDEAENDWFDFLQAGWIHQQGAGTLEIRYGYSRAHLDSWPANQTSPNQSRIELLGSTVSGAPPLSTFAQRPRHEIAMAWRAPVVVAVRSRHSVTAGGNWERSSPRNQMMAPSDLNLITVAGAPAYVVQYNTPVNSIGRIQNFSAYLSDHVTFADRVSLDLGMLADISRGSLPAQSSIGGTFISPRSFPGSGDLISWNNVSPRAAIAWQVPWLRRVLVTGSYRRTYSPLAGRYLDYGNPNALGGTVYGWVDRNGDGWFQPDEQGALLLRFGGPYSSVGHSLQRPYADEFDVSASVAVNRNTFAGIQLFRRDEKHRIVAVDNGLGANAFSPVQILDPGPDGVAGTFDDQHLTVYSQNPATLGKDSYALTNAPGLRELNVGFTAEVRTAWRTLLLRAAFTAEKAWGPTNPGNAPFENDPDVVGTLFTDPNSTTPTLARSYVDRSYLGKIQAMYRLPSVLGRLEVATIANYMDGLPFARELLVPGLPQGPFLIPTTVRGSPEGGNRAQYVLNWNLRVLREFQVSVGRLAASADLLNVTNSGQAIQQSDLTNRNFNLRLPVAIQPARFLRLGLTYRF